jgi:hypothetical protein
MRIIMIILHVFSIERKIAAPGACILKKTLSGYNFGQAMLAMRTQRDDLIASSPVL